MTDIQLLRICFAYYVFFYYYLSGSSTSQVSCTSDEHQPEAAGLSKFMEKNNLFLCLSQPLASCTAIILQMYNLSTK